MPETSAHSARFDLSPTLDSVTNRFWERLSVIVVIVLVFAAVYFRFLKRP